ncbi:type II secretion system protein GspM [Variovorax sp. J22R133]|uniref:type II secretion system protein GspM n=1 Tax=Variovorax brevis TaxID=3053503 RepID=UPI00257682DE|nr:type II secretion system protein GspM [Variovorax sp. J22R133]MDM0114497.1 type II secretion system protein GspM [Variovorax sp. J22R133]
MNTAQLRTYWTELAPRERRMVSIAVTVIVVALLWWVALAPAIRTLSAAPAEHARLDTQLQQMRTLQAQAKDLQAQPRANRADAVRALETAVSAGLGPTAQVQNSGGGEAVSVSVRGASAEALAQWLAQARGNARAVPREIHLTRSKEAPAATAKDAAADDSSSSKVRWDGTLSMSLPAAR